MAAFEKEFFQARQSGSRRSKGLRCPKRLETCQRLSLRVCASQILHHRGIGCMIVRQHMIRTEYWRLVPQFLNSSQSYWKFQSSGNEIDCWRWRIEKQQLNKACRRADGFQLFIWEETELGSVKTSDIDIGSRWIFRNRNDYSASNLNQLVLQSSKLNLRTCIQAHTLRLAVLPVRLQQK